MEFTEVSTDSQRWQTFQPIPQRLSTCMGAEEDRGNSLSLSFERVRLGVFVRWGRTWAFAHPSSVPYTVHAGKQGRDAIRRARRGVLWDLGRLEPFAL